ncbi:F-box protein At1g55000-like [Tasmannia lanceolata]|uniref:F-box protein At1g55000-like n=1 Tax=Tasmannia lanceolata TaxID=3420 RepID=UPI004064B896
MGCCGDEDDEILKQLIPYPTETLENERNLAGKLSYSRNGLSSSSSNVISPLNSNFSALISRDILRIIFEKLTLSDLARSACVCRVWNSVASDREIQTRSFKSPWKLKEIVGNPTSGGFWRDNSLGRFAISHRLVREDTMAGLAVKYSVQVMDIKRVNNMMSDHGIYSRQRLLIPLSKPDVLLNSTCYIELDVYAKREVAVLYLEGRPDGKLNYLANRTNERGKKRIIDTMKRSMQVDDGTAEYYLAISNGNPRAAFSQFSSDLRWEQQARES